jgi:hypothetical protein
MGDVGWMVSTTTTAIREEEEEYAKISVVAEAAIHWRSTGEGQEGALMLYLKHRV